MFDGALALFYLIPPPPITGLFFGIRPLFPRITISLFIERRRNKAPSFFWNLGIYDFLFEKSERIRNTVVSLI